jgi:predicted phage-related endonuclease
MVNLHIDSAAQGTPEWLAARAGYITGSRAEDIVARRKDGQPTAAYHDYLIQLVAERLTGQPQETGIVTPWMTRGTELEPAARAALEQALDEPIFECGFITRADDPLRVGCSIDGYIGSTDYIVELKCPKPTTHLRYAKDDELPDAHFAQVLHNMWVTGASRAVFASYCPQMPLGLQLIVRHVPRTTVEHALDAYGAQVAAFDVSVNEQVEYWRTYGES